MIPNNKKIWAVVPAAGVGKRMESSTPKQYLPLAEKTLIETTIGKLLQLAWLEGVIVALGEGDEYWLNTEFVNHPKIIRAAGGKERSDSVFSCLTKLREIENNSSIWVLVHDAARPCFSFTKVTELVETCIAENTGGILAAPVADTVKRVEQNEKSVDIGSVVIKSTEDRSQLWLAHTPQFYSLEELHFALKTCEEKQLPVTDEASAIEAVGGKSIIVADRIDNIKVTLPEDLDWAEHILALNN